MSVCEIQDNPSKIFREMRINLLLHLTKKWVGGRKAYMSCYGDTFQNYWNLKQPFTDGGFRAAIIANFPVLESRDIHEKSGFMKGWEKP